VIFEYAIKNYYIVSNRKLWGVLQMFVLSLINL